MCRWGLVKCVCLHVRVPIHQRGNTFELATTDRVRWLDVKSRDTEQRLILDRLLSLTSSGHEDVRLRRINMQCSFKKANRIIFSFKWIFNIVQNWQRRARKKSSRSNLKYFGQCRKEDKQRGNTLKKPPTLLAAMTALINCHSALMLATNFGELLSFPVF